LYQSVSADNRPIVRCRLYYRPTDNWPVPYRCISNEKLYQGYSWDSHWLQLWCFDVTVSVLQGLTILSVDHLTYCVSHKPTNNYVCHFFSYDGPIWPTWQY